MEESTSSSSVRAGESEGCRWRREERSGVSMARSVGAGAVRGRRG